MGRIKHEGIIQSIDDQGIHVRITQMAACASCKVASQCQMSDKKEKIVDVENHGSSHMKEGDNVMVYTEEAMGFKAVFLAFILPFLLMIGALVVVSAITHDEPLAALSGIVILIPYYWVLFTRKEKLKKQFQFKLETNQ